MDRSTEKHLDGNDHYMKCSGEYSCADNCNDCCELAKIVERLAAYEDTGLEPEDVYALQSYKLLDEYEREKLFAYKGTGMEPEEIENMKAIQDGFRGNEYIVLNEHLKSILKAETDGRLVVLPFPVHSALVNMSDLERPELMKDFRISATWTHCGIVFHSPWGIFSELVKSGSIKRTSQETEATLKGEGEND